MLACYAVQHAKCRWNRSLKTLPVWGRKVPLLAIIPVGLPLNTKGSHTPQGLSLVWPLPRLRFRWFPSHQKLSSRLNMFSLSRSHSHRTRSLQSGMSCDAIIISQYCFWNTHWGAYTVTTRIAAIDLILRQSRFEQSPVIFACVRAYINPSDCYDTVLAYSLDPTLSCKGKQQKLVWSELFPNKINCLLEKSAVTASKSDFDAITWFLFKW